MTVIDNPVFLLSPARCSGQRAGWLLRDDPRASLGQRLRRGEPVSLGEVFAFVSGLYFRGKLTYATRFAACPDDIHVITPNQGLLPAESRLTLEQLQSYAGVDISIDNQQYREPLERDLAALAASLRQDRQVVLLGSVASPKYVDVLTTHLGERLRFPVDFVGRGDMSRGGLLLRAAESGIELPYRPVAGASRRGQRPPKLEPRPRRTD